MIFLTIYLIGVLAAAVGVGMYYHNEGLLHVGDIPAFLFASFFSWIAVIIIVCLVFENNADKIIWRKK